MVKAERRPLSYSVIFALLFRDMASTHTHKHTHTHTHIHTHTHTHKQAGGDSKILRFKIPISY
jgi:hypothetical protein